MKSKQKNNVSTTEIFNKKNFTIAYIMTSFELCNFQLDIRVKTRRIFRINNIIVNSIQNFDTSFNCRCNIEYVCLQHWKKKKITFRVLNVTITSNNNKKSNKNFLIIRRVVKREIDISQSFEHLKKWIKNENITLKFVISNAKARLKILQLL